MTDRELMQAMSEQIGELVRHVAEVRQSNTRLEVQVQNLRTDIDSMRGDIDSMRGDIHALNVKIDDKTEYISGKMDHFIEFYSRESANIRARYEEVQYDRAVDRRKTDQRFDEIEDRLARLEAAASS